MVRHYTPEELARFSDDPSQAGDRQAIEGHLQACVSCQETLAIIRTVDDALHAEETWHFADELESARHQQ
ncbi:MAG: hypothetical protein ACXW31_10535, partial [Thermoanaerobaculia bacterium]